MLLDLLIVVGCAFALYRGIKLGFVRQFLSAGGFFAGLMVGVWVTPRIIDVVDGPALKSALTLFVVLGTGLMLLMVGEFIGLQLKYRIMPKRLHLPDNGLGGVVGIASLLVAAWLGASIVSSTATPELQRTIRDSRIISGLDRLLPPAPGVVARLSHVLDPNGFPDVFIDNEPVPRTPVNLPSLGDLAAAVNADRDSVVRIKGEGCGGIVSGSGFVVRRDVVATNAHVVAGIRQPYVQDGDGSHEAEAIWFDPELDFALLKADGLDEPSLKFNSDIVAPETPAAILGYPGGGNFSAKTGVVLDEIIAGGRNIYGYGYTKRHVYELHADIHSGNSGGPVVGKDGRVIGMVFAASTTYDNVGYALISDHLDDTVARAVSDDRAVGTGPCAR